MRFAQLIGLGLILQFASLAVWSQPADDEAVKEKQRKFAVLIDQVLSELPNLRLAENRAFLNAKVGNILWDGDERRARALFNDAVSELLNAQQEAAQSKPDKGQASCYLP